MAELSKLFNYNENKSKIISIIQQVSHYHLSPIDEETRKSYLEAKMKRGNNKSSHSEMNSSSLDKSTIK